MGRLSQGNSWNQDATTLEHGGTAGGELGEMAWVRHFAEGSPLFRFRRAPVFDDERQHQEAARGEPKRLDRDGGATGEV